MPQGNQLDKLEAMLQARRQQREAQSLQRQQMLEQIQLRQDAEDQQFEFQAKGAEKRLKDMRRAQEKAAKEREKRLKEQGKQLPPPGEEEPILGAPPSIDVAKPRPDMDPLGGLNPQSLGVPEGARTMPIQAPAAQSVSGQMAPPMMGGGGGAVMAGGQSFPVPDLLTRATRTDGLEQTSSGMMPTSKITTEVEPNVLTAAQAATIRQMQERDALELAMQERQLRQAMILARNKTYTEVFKDLASEVTPSVAAQLARATADGNLDAVEELTSHIPDTATGRLIKQRTVAAAASAQASRASAANSMEGARNKRLERTMMMLEPMATAVASPFTSPEESEKLAASIIGLDPQTRGLFDSMVAAQRGTPQSTEGKRAYDFGVNPRVQLTPEERLKLVTGEETGPVSTLGKTAQDLGVDLGTFTPAEKKDLLTKAGSTSITVNTGTTSGALTEIQKDQKTLADSRNRLTRASNMLREDFLGAKGRNTARLMGFAADNTGFIPLAPELAEIAARKLSGLNPGEVDEWYDQYTRTVAVAGRDAAQAIHDLYGANVVAREDTRAQQFITDLQRGDPVKVVATMGEALTYANMRLAGYKIYQMRQANPSEGGVPVNPWDISDAQVAQTVSQAYEAMYEGLAATTPDPKRRALLAMQTVEDQFNITRGFGRTIMKEYGYGK
jgi:hypothetical protein